MPGKNLRFNSINDLGEVKVGDLVTLAYYQSMALSAAKKGEPNPLFTGGDAATAAPGEKPAGYVAQQTKRTVTVAAVDAERRSVVFRGEDGTLFPVEVERPEFARKLETLRVGDQLDVVVTEAVIAEVKPAAPGSKPSVTHEVGTLIVDRGEIVRRVGHTLFIRNEQGRMIRVAVDPKFKSRSTARTTREAQSLMLIPVFLTEENLAWAVRKDDAALLESANLMLDTWRSSGKLKSTIKQWIPSAPDERIP